MLVMTLSFCLNGVTGTASALYQLPYGERQRDVNDGWKQGAREGSSEAVREGERERETETEGYKYIYIYI